jgi:protoporphyrinogen oxidase
VPTPKANNAATSAISRATADTPIVVIGAGPAGLTCAMELARQGVPTLVVDADSRVGGIAQTSEYKGFRFDIGGHRFFTKVPGVAELWRSILGPDFIRRPRLSRIYYNKKFFDYPLKPMNALANLGILKSVAILASYLWSNVRPIHPEVSFEDWVSNRFGRRLYKTFFETYTEKVWGIPCRTISAQWAAQRIKGLSLKTAVINMLFPQLNRRPGQTVKTLIDEFEYPRLGPGMMWEAFAREIERMGGRIELKTRATRILHDGETVAAVELERDGVRVLQPAVHVISTMPVRELVRSLEPAPPGDIRCAADRLKYRDFLTVALIVDQADVFADNWIYIHDETVKVGRIQNYKNWSPDMVPDQSKTCLGLEYFCTVGDALWSMSDEELVELGKKELAQIGLARFESILDGTVVRMPKAYPVYDEGFTDALDDARHYLERFQNLQLIGRNGTHKYNNQDHSMVMAMLAVRNLFGEQHDLWAVNADDEYHEEVTENHEDTTSPLATDLRNLSSTQPLVPTQVPSRAAVGSARI